MKLTKLASTGNFTKLELFNYLSIYFSYETPIAMVTLNQTFITKNNWAQTTGKHINKVKQFHPEHTVVEHDELIDKINLEI